MKIAVLGAGIAGLTTAFHLQKKGHDVVVYEARDRVGGNIFTERHEGCTVEWGPNGFLDNEPAVLGLVQELGLQDELVRSNPDAATRYIWRAGKLRALPTSPRSFVFGDLLPLGARLRVLAEPRFAKRELTGADPSVHEFFAHRFGPAAADVLADAFVTGIWAGDPKRLSFRAAFPKMARLKGSLLKRGASGPAGTLTSFRTGMHTIIDALAERVTLERHAPWESLEPRAFDRVVCTTPAARTPATGALRDALARIPYAPVAVVALAFPRADVKAPDGFGFLAPHGQGLRILGALYETSIFPERAPDGLGLYRVLIGGRRDPDALALDDEALTDLALRDLGQAWTSVPTPQHVFIHRWPLGIAQFEQGHEALLQTIRAATPPWLRLAGSSYQGISFNACVAEAVHWSP